MTASSEASGGQQRVLDIALCIWFIVTGAAFFAPYLGVALPDMTAIYGAFLLLSMAALALRLLRGSSSGADNEAVGEAAAAAQAGGAAPAVSSVTGQQQQQQQKPARERKKRRG